MWQGVLKGRQEHDGVAQIGHRLLIPFQTPDESFGGCASNAIQNLLNDKISDCQMGMIDHYFKQDRTKQLEHSC